MQIAKQGDFGTLANRRIVVVRIIDDSTAIVSPMVSMTAIMMFGGRDGQIVKAAPGRQFILSDHPTAGLPPGGNFSHYCRRGGQTENHRQPFCSRSSSRST